MSGEGFLLCQLAATNYLKAVCAALPAGRRNYWKISRAICAQNGLLISVISSIATRLPKRSFVASGSDNGWLLFCGGLSAFKRTIVR